MKKQNIIQSIVNITVPAGAQLVQHEVRGTGLSFAHMGTGDTGGLKVMMAQMFIDQLTNDVADLADEPSSTLFERLHQAVLDFNEGMIAGTVIEAAEEEIAADHRKMIERLRGIAKDLGISYNEPNDPLLK